MNTRLLKKIERISLDLLHLPNASNKHFSFLIRRNKIIAMGYNNSWKTHPIANKYGHRHNSIHSEIAVLSQYINLKYLKDKDLGLDMVNVRIYPNTRSFGYSYPCKYCCSLIKSFDIKGLYFYSKSGKWEYQTNF